MKFRMARVWAIVVASSFFLSACGNPQENTERKSLRETVLIEDVHGEVEVPKNPERVVSLDNRSFETLESWGVPLLAAPKDVMPPGLSYREDDAIVNIGNHREPKLELIAAADPELVIVGQRFAGFYDEIKALVPNAVVIDLNIDVSETASTPAENLVKGFLSMTKDLGQIFGKEEEADALITQLEESIEAAKSAYNGSDRIMAVIVSGGSIGYSAPGTGRVWGPLYELFDWEAALDVGNSSSNHQGDEISVEAIAQSNPDWLLVLDRDASTSSNGEEVYIPAEDVLKNSPALANVRAVQDERFIYAPADTYTNESIQTFIELFETLAEEFRQG